MLRAIIIDDEQKGINSLSLLISKFIPDVKIVAEATEAITGVELIEDFKPEIVFLDIKMPHMDGFELLQKLNFKNFNLIFTTAHDEFAIKAIKNNALDYLLKPIDLEDLEIAIRKIKEKRDQKQKLPDFSKLFAETKDQNQKIPFHTKDKVEYIYKNDLLRLESDSNYTTVFTIDGKKLMLSKTIGDYENILCFKENDFMRVHQSHIINLKYVKKFSKENGGIIFMANDQQIPLSKNKRDEFIKWLDL